MTGLPFKARDLEKLIADYQDPNLGGDMQRWCAYEFPWGSTKLPYPGPRVWQGGWMDDVSQAYRDNRKRVEDGGAPQIVRTVTTSGRGPGKTAIVFFTSGWMMCHALGSTTLVSANSEDQLRKKTFAEFSVWKPLMKSAPLWELEGLRMVPTEAFGKVLVDQVGIGLQYFYTAGQLWNENNPGAFKGAHNRYGVQYLLDESATIPRAIWEAADFGLTELAMHRYIHAFGNPQEPSGALFDCFNTDAARWIKHQIDARTVEGLDTAELNRKIAKYGIESDVVRVDILGQFPKKGIKSLISRAAVALAMELEWTEEQRAQNRALYPLVMGVDTARDGDDSSIFAWRRGYDLRYDVPPVERFEKLRTDDLLAELIRHANRTRPALICIDMGSTGAALYDLAKRRGLPVHPVWFSGAPAKPRGTPPDAKKFETLGNKRLQIWEALGDLVDMGAMLPRDESLADELCEPRVVHRRDKRYLEDKADIKAADRLGRSPDWADALACTMDGEPVSPRWRQQQAEAIPIDKRGGLADPKLRAQLGRGRGNSKASSVLDAILDDFDG